MHCRMYNPGGRSLYGGIEAKKSNGLSVGCCDTDTGGQLLISDF